MEFIGVDPDTPVYRIFPLRRFEEVLGNREMTLVSPECWNDPFEVLSNRTAVLLEDSPPQGLFLFEQYLAPTYVQCWSRNSESDVLMRAYSRVLNSRVQKDCHSQRNTCPEDEGVQVRTTPRKLSQALEQASSAESRCFCGAVEYLSPDSIKSRLAALTRLIGTEALEHVIGDDIRQAINDRARIVLGDLKTAVQLLLLKRSAFEHEEEVRFMLVSHKYQSNQRSIHIPTDPNIIFEEVMFDPRLVASELKERKQCARDLGYVGPFRDSDRYLFTHIHIKLSVTRIAP